MHLLSPEAVLMKSSLWRAVTCHSVCEHFVRCKMMTVITSGQSNLTERSHRRRTWTVQSCRPGSAALQTFPGQVIL